MHPELYKLDDRMKQISKKPSYEKRQQYTAQPIDQPNHYDDGHYDGSPSYEFIKSDFIFVHKDGKKY